MTPFYSAEVEQDRDLLKLRLPGFFSIEDVRAFAQVRNVAMTKLRCAPNRHLTRCDARGGMLSKPEVATEFQRLLGDSRHASRRLAYVVDGAMAKLQANRVLGRSSVAFFAHVEEAERWLFRDFCGEPFQTHPDANACPTAKH